MCSSDLYKVRQRAEGNIFAVGSLPGAWSSDRLRYSREHPNRVESTKVTSPKGIDSGAAGPDGAIGGLYEALFSCDENVQVEGEMSDISFKNRRCSLRSEFAGNLRYGSEP